MKELSSARYISGSSRESEKRSPWYIHKHISNLLLYYIEIDHTLANYNYYVILNIKYWLFYPQLRNGLEFLEVQLFF
jgi:hypothetical protein